MPRTLTRQGDVRKELEDTHTALEANAPDLPHLDVHRKIIGDVLEVIRTCTTEQDVYRANKQQSSKRLSAALREGRKALTVVRVILKQHYGSDNEKLQEFGVQPFRGRTRELKARPTTPVNPPVTPEVKPQVRPTDKPSSDTDPEPKS